MQKFANWTLPVIEYDIFWGFFCVISVAHGYPHCSKLPVVAVDVSEQEYALIGTFESFGIFTPSLMGKSTARISSIILGEAW